MNNTNLLKCAEQGDKANSCIVLLHGFCEDKSIWANLQNHLSASFYTIAVDLPGFGDNAANINLVAIEDFAKEVHNTLQSLQVKQCIMIGHSLGGYVSLAFADLYPNMLKGLVLFHSSAFADSAEKIESRNKAIDFVTKNGAAEFVKNLIPTLFSEKNKSKYQQDIADLIDKAKNLSPKTIINTLSAMRDRKDKMKVLKKIVYPVLYIIGKEDAAIPLEDSRAQSHIANQAFACYLSDCGHMGMIEQKEITTKAIESFVAICD